MEGFIIFYNIFVIIQSFCSGVMCVYGYKWSRKLIAIMSGYIGILFGAIVVYFDFSTSGNLGSILLLPIFYLAFIVLAYKSVRLNQFCAAYLLTLKISFMVLYALMDADIIEDDALALLTVPVFLGLILSAIIFNRLKNRIVLLCLAFIGAIEVVPKVVSLFNGTLFAATGDLGFIFDPVDFLLSKLGIETLSFIEVILIIVVFMLSYRYQKQKAVECGMDLDARDMIIDDRHYQSK